MAKKSARPKFLPILLVLLLYHEVSASNGPRKRRSRHLEPSDQFSSHFVVEPRLFHGRSKREIATTRHDDVSLKRHLDHLTVTFDGEDERQFVLDLQLNRQLIPDNYFQKRHHQVKIEAFFRNFSE